MPQRKQYMQGQRQTLPRRLCRDAQVPEEKGNPRCLKRLYQTTRGGIQNNISLLEQEKLAIGWGEY